MLAVIDYGAGNLRSVLHALKHIGAANVQIVEKPEQLTPATRIILPGVGAFGYGMEQLAAQGLIEPLKKQIQSGIPYLGICLGMQFLFDYSDEMGNHPGLGILSGKVTRFPEFTDRKVPHMGWNQIKQTKDSPLLANIAEGGYAYFVHSYYCIPSNPSDELIEVDYGIPFTAAVQHDNIFGVQFHPEKSQRLGLQILRNFLTI